jgi:hypothetical protein
MIPLLLGVFVTVQYSNESRSDVLGFEEQETWQLATAMTRDFIRQTKYDQKTACSLYNILFPLIE